MIDFLLIVSVASSIMAGMVIVTLVMLISEFVERILEKKEKNDD